MKGALALLLSVLAMPCLAQDEAADRRAAEVVACVTRPQGLPSRPEGASGGVVRILAEFTGPDAPPKVTILKPSGNTALDAAVENFVSMYRVPCMRPSDPPFDAEQEFIFESPTTDPQAAAALACIRLAVYSRDHPIYPEHTNGGRVRIQLEFTAPDAPPKVTILEPSGDAELDGAIQRFAYNYRLPCMRPGDATVRSAMNFVVDSTAPTTFGTSLRASATGDEALVACVKRAGEAAQPEYLDRRLLGNVLVEATFRAPDAEPEIKIAAAAPSQQLNDAAREFVRGYRMPCLNGRAVKTWQLFRFRAASSEFSTTLQAYLKLTPGGRPAPVEFDLDALGCPFRVGLQYWEPVRRNEAWVYVPAALPAQKPFLDWLASRRLEAPMAENLLLGEEVKIKVSCGKINP